MKKSCSDPFSHASSSISARFIIFSIAVWFTESDESATSTAQAAAHAAPVQYSSGTCFFVVFASAASGSLRICSLNPGNSTSNARMP